MPNAIAPSETKNDILVKRIHDAESEYIRFSLITSPTYQRPLEYSKSIIVSLTLFISIHFCVPLSNPDPTISPDRKTRRTSQFVALENPTRNLEG